jgi:hypothetical protein
MKSSAGVIDLMESAAIRLREALSVLKVIEGQSLLAELPQNREAAERHQCAVSLLVLLRRELDGVATELQAACLVQSVLFPAERPNRQ